ncbi:hypothetical protein [Tautonia plasticadhaerens]|uniref:Uncharacterized protein n=1 Tax=Tautonia plasticadhaerens TaxID=2527974 RepID=A0A518HD87_9BACT|nr:hypothetical protein [Tautonia plasticadhaerens]QDV38800.1 hypothetical protein ElP_67570 [Tautonia plasticadhaerens]
MRRSLTVLLSLGLVLGLGAIRSLVAQDEEPAPAVSAPEAPQEGQDETKAEAPASEAPAPASSSSTDELPPEVQQKREAALKAVAELIVAAEEAGLVQTNVEPPPILDVLVLGKSTDKTDLEAASGNAETQVGLVNPEAFAAYFTGYAEPPEGLTAQANVRIRQPSEGLKEFFDKRADALRPYLEAARSASSASPEAAPADEPKAEEPAPAPADEPAPAPADEPAEETKKDEAPADEPKAEEPKDEPAPAEEPEVPVSPEPAPAEPKEEPKDEPNAEEPKAEEPKAEEPKEEPKAEEPNEEPSTEEPEADEPN